MEPIHIHAIHLASFIVTFVLLILTLHYHERCALAEARCRRQETKHHQQHFIPDTPMSIAHFLAKLKHDYLAIPPKEIEAQLQAIESWRQYYDHVERAVGATLLQSASDIAAMLKKDCDCLEQNFVVTDSSRFNPDHRQFDLKLEVRHTATLKFSWRVGVAIELAGDNNPLFSQLLECEFQAGKNNAFLIALAIPLQAFEVRSITDRQGNLTDTTAALRYELKIANRAVYHQETNINVLIDVAAEFNKIVQIIH